MALWTEIAYHSVPFTDSRLDRYFTEIRSLYANGGAYSECVEADDTVLFDDALRNDRQGMRYRLASFLGQPSVGISLHALGIPKQIPATLDFRCIGRYQLEGVLVERLLNGGLYHRYNDTTEVARALSRDCADAVCDKPFEAWDCYEIIGAWADAFFDVGCDSTFVLCSGSQRRWLVLWMTDTD